MWKFIGLLFLLFINGCGLSTKEYIYPSPSLATSNFPNHPITNWVNPIHLKFGEKIVLSDGFFQITFLDVVEDTRCSNSDAACQQHAGNAQVSLIIQPSSGKEVKMLLNTDAKLAQEAWVDGHTIRLIQIAPELPPGPPSEKSSYEIWIQVLLI